MEKKKRSIVTEVVSVRYCDSHPCIDCERGMSPQGFRDGGMKTSCLVLRTQGGGHLYQNLYEYRCCHDDVNNPLWEVIYYDMKVKDAIKAYELDFATFLISSDDWRDNPPYDVRRGCHVHVSKDSSIQVTISWS
jgi:hypothetical protein